MKEIFVVSPVKHPEDILNFTKKVKCREFYVYHHRFMKHITGTLKSTPGSKGTFEYINEYINAAKKTGSKIFVNFKHSITEEDVTVTKKFIEFLTTTDIDGIFVNSYGILEIIKTMDLPFKVIIDSYFDIHNLSGVEFMEMFHKIDGLIITEEVYLKNIEKISKYAKIPLSVDSDNLPYFADDLIKSKAISAVVIKGKFNSSDEILNGIKLIEKILDKPKMFKEQKLPFKHVRKSFYKTSHYSGEILSATGEDFKFANYIQKYDWKIKCKRLPNDMDYSKIQLPKLNLRLSSLEQFKELRKFIKTLGFNPVNSIEYGEVACTVDLATHPFEELINKARKFCTEFNMDLNISTPRILIERDFERVYEIVKMLCLTDPKPKTVVINNIGFFWAKMNDPEFQATPVEIGGGINLLNSYSIKCLSNLNPIDALDFSALGDEENIIKCIKKSKKIIRNKKIQIAGGKRVESLGLCPLNCNSAVVSRLTCAAPCHRGHWSVKDPSLNKILPFVVDGFCKMHMFESEIEQNFDMIPHYTEVGINEFVIDFLAIHSTLLPRLLKNFLCTVSNFK